MIDLQNPRQTSVTEYGGQAIFRQNMPRALFNVTPLRAVAPGEWDQIALSGTDSSTESGPDVNDKATIERKYAENLRSK